MIVSARLRTLSLLTAVGLAGGLVAGCEEEKAAGNTQVQGEDVVKQPADSSADAASSMKTDAAERQQGAEEVYEAAKKAAQEQYDSAITSANTDFESAKEMGTLSAEEAAERFEGDKARAKAELDRALEEANKVYEASQ